MYKNLLSTLKPILSFLPVQLIIKKSFIILIFISFLFEQNKSYSDTANEKFDDYGIISIMYHRFEENKYPSTNIRISDFKNTLK